jgi:hypothetical protein
MVVRHWQSLGRPSPKTAGHVDYVESLPLQNAGRDCGSSSAEAVNHHWPGTIDFLNLAEQLAEEPMFGTGNVSFLELGCGPHIQHLDFARFNGAPE